MIHSNALKALWEHLRRPITLKFVLVERRYIVAEGMLLILIGTGTEQVKRQKLETEVQQ